MDEAQADGELLEGRQLNLFQQFTYALGNFGVAFSPAVVAAWLGVFYFGQEGEGGAAPIVYLGPATFGIIWFLCNALNGPTDPIVGYLSDHTRSRWGRRKPWVMVGAPMLALSFFFLWTPATDTPSFANAAILFAALFGFWFFFTVVVAPYLSLLPEITPYNSERIRISTLMALCEVFGTGFGTVLPNLFMFAAAGFLFLATRHQTMAFFAGCSLVLFFYLSVAFVKERHRPAQKETSGTKAWVRAAFKEFGSTFNNKPFRPYVVCVGFYRMAISTTVFIAPFLSTKVISEYGATDTDMAFLETFSFLGSISEDGTVNWEGAAGVLMLLVLFGGLPFFPLVSWLANKVGKRALFMLAQIWFAVILLLMSTIGFWPFLTPMLQAAALFAFAAFPVAVSLIVIRPILADIIDEDEKLTGQRREGVYNGMEGLIMKVAAGLGPMIAGFIFAAFGSTTGDNLGVRLCGPVAGVLLLIAAYTFSKYPIRR